MKAGQALPLRVLDMTKVSRRYALGGGSRRFLFLILTPRRCQHRLDINNSFGELDVSFRL